MDIKRRREAIKNEFEMIEALLHYRDFPSMQQRHVEENSMLRSSRRLSQKSGEAISPTRDGSASSAAARCVDQGKPNGPCEPIYTATPFND